MKSQARIKISSKSLFVHFEKVGRKAHFEKILNRWLVVFPQSQWSDTYRAWELPVANFEDVKLFCDKMFGKVIVEPLTPPTKRINQLELNF
ncbi:MAG: hypothetical protein KDJ52_26005 [Anaerolineae bacterium]|nr:hypothetical protein [Anaerolineae bacterium]MCB0212824.1 hypothetical protein [Anaerolineae bacterium]